MKMRFSSFVKKIKTWYDKYVPLIEVVALFFAAFSTYYAYQSVRLSREANKDSIEFKKVIEKFPLSVDSVTQSFRELSETNKNLMQQQLDNVKRMTEATKKIQAGSNTLAENLEKTSGLNNKQIALMENQQRLMKEQQVLYQKEISRKAVLSLMVYSRSIDTVANIVNFSIGINNTGDQVARDVSFQFDIYRNTNIKVVAMDQIETNNLTIKYVYQTQDVIYYSQATVVPKGKYPTYATESIYLSSGEYPTYIIASTFTYINTFINEEFFYYTPVVLQVPINKLPLSIDYRINYEKGIYTGKIDLI